MTMNLTGQGVKAFAFATAPPQKFTARLGGIRVWGDVA